MTKLFLSLYIFILLAMATIGWGGEWLWQKLQPRHNQQQNITSGSEQAWLTSAQLAAAWYQDSAQHNQAQLLTQLSQQFATQVSVINKQDLPIQISQQGLVSYLDDNRLMVFQPLVTKEQVLQIGPIVLADNTADEQTLKTTLLFISYLMLALFVALWTWPLWRDLRALERSSEQIAKGQFEQTSAIAPTSPVYFLAQAMHNMANKIGELIEGQKMMLNAVSHDLRTPLSRLKFSLAVEDKNEQKQSMQQDINALEKLIDELLSFARFEHQNQSIQLAQIPLEQVCQSVIENLQPSDVCIQFECKLAENQLWLCDGFLFERIVQNLLSNAVKYAKSQVKLELNIVESKLLLIVDDDGDGITKENWPYIFKPFYRIEKGQKNAHKGFGLGLAIVAKIAAWHQGRCYVEQAPIGGARFVVELR
ncbi:ATP-binding protein [Catenovulum sp. SX2]|uniref:ATP-binding protein n=1 Tax=Catenovulum sp. SX2 TaxID=3398614 RepID=UPI003F82C14F